MKGIGGHDAARSGVGIGWAAHGSQTSGAPGWAGHGWAETGQRFCLGCGYGRCVRGIIGRSRRVMTPLAGFGWRAAVGRPGPSAPSLPLWPVGLVALG